MAGEAQGSHIREVTFPSASRDRHNMVRVPEVPAATPVPFELFARFEIELTLVLAQLLGIGAAQGADAAVAREDLVAQIAAIGAQFPFVDAGRAAECEALRRNGAPAPPARAALARDPATGHGAIGAHD
jgi:hypothetical protein